VHPAHRRATAAAGRVRRAVRRVCPRRRRDEHGVRIHLVGSAALRGRVEDLVARELQCCSFFTFAVEGGDDDLTLGISVPEQRRDILDALADRAQELSG
jgi:hypothetical protein